MKDEVLNRKIKEITASIQQELGEEELPVIKVYHSGDELINNLLLTTDNKGLAGDSESKDAPKKSMPSSKPGGKGPADKGDGDAGETENGQQGQDGEDGEGGQGGDEPDTDGIKLPGEGEGGQENGDEDEGGEKDDKEGEGKGGEGKIKVGTKVKIKSTGQDGVVIGQLPDGSWTVAPLTEEQKKERGGTINSMAVGAILDGQEVLGDFPETDLEVIQPESKGGGKSGKGQGKGKPGRGKGQGQPGSSGQGEPNEGELGQQGAGEPGQGQPGQGQNAPPVLDRAALEARFNALQNLQLQLPTFAYAIFGARMEWQKDGIDDEFQSGSMFTIKSNLAILNQFAKSIFSQKNPAPSEVAKEMKEIYASYEQLVIFIKQNGVFRDDGYFYDNDSPSYWMAKSELDSGSVKAAYEFLERVDAMINLDAKFYRLVSLIAFLNPDIFGDGFMKIHLDCMFRFFRVSKIPFTNNSILLFSSDVFTYGSLYPYISENMSIYNTMKNNDRDDYIIMEFKNVMCKDVGVGGDRGSSTTTYKNHILSEQMTADFFETERGFLMNIYIQLINFYRMAVDLRDNSSYKETVMKNIEFLLSLQNDKVRLPLSDFLLEVSIST